MKDKFGNNYRLPQERWQHILTNHPELLSRKEEIAKTLDDPDVIIKSRNDPDVLIYQKKNQQKYFLTVVVHSKKGFVVTAFVTDKIKIGKIIWQKDKTNN